MLRDVAFSGNDCFGCQIGTVQKTYFDHRFKGVHLSDGAAKLSLRHLIQHMPHFNQIRAIEPFGEPPEGLPKCRKGMAR